MTRALGFIATFLLLLSGCASPARFVERRPDGGTVAVPSYAEREEAIELIEREVGPAAHIVHEAEVVTGTDTKSIAETGEGSVLTRIATWFTGTKHVATAETKTIKATEWRIDYQTTAGKP